MFPLHQVRQDTPACEKVVHLNNAGASLPPRVVTQAMLDYLSEESQHGGYETAAKYADRCQNFYHALARLLNTKEKNIAFVGNATDAFAKSLLSIPLKKGDTILTSQDDYVSNQLIFLQLRDRLGVQVMRVPNSESGPIDLTAAEEMIRKYQPKLFSLSHVPTNSGLIQPVAEIGKLCQQYDCWYVVDACQSAGQLQLDVQEIQCDFLCASFRKFMRGPRGAGFLFVSDKVLDANLAPIGIDLQGAQWKAADQYELGSSAKRFEYWERSHALLLGSTVAVEYLLELGMKRVEDYLQEIGNYSRSILSAIPQITLLDRGAQQANIITFQVLGKSQREITTELNHHQINFSFSSRENALIDFTEKGVDWAVRVSPHYYNIREEIDLLAEVLKKLNN